MECVKCGVCCKNKKCSELVIVERMGTSRIYGLCGLEIEGRGKCTKRSNDGKGGYCTKGMVHVGIVVSEVPARMEDYNYILESFQELHSQEVKVLKKVN